ncbi:MAG: penicillin-binding protein 2 [Candidatus Omnitrophica bacterium]|nr:penicillin-binding protein 2 [Candidatus Omnitrophota bacterium]
MRVQFLRRVIAAGLCGIWLGLFWTQGIHGGAFRRKSERNRTRLIHLPAARGSIVDRLGVPLAEDRIGFELKILPQELKTPDQTWRRLAELTGVPAEELERRYRKGFEARFSPVTVIRDLSPHTAFLLEEERNRLPGLFVQAVPHRTYPLGKAVGSVCGYLGLIAAEELTRLKPYGYTYRDWVGKDGLEQRYDETLRGVDGGLYLEVNAQGKMVQQMGYRVPQRGRQIQVSIDSRLQALCHRLIEGAAGGIAVMDVRTGEVLALVSLPSFDPGVFLQPSRADEVRNLLRNSSQPMFNRLTRAMVPPGSTFKAAVAYEALKEKKVSSGSAFECAGVFRLGRSEFNCWQEQGHGPQTVAEALEHSCNVYFYNIGRRLGVDGIAQAARLFRLGQPTGIDLPREAKGLVPDAAWMRQVYRKPWQEGDTISFAIGQGALQVTPLQMLMMFTAIARNGDVPHPHLLLGVEGQEKPKTLSHSALSLDLSALAPVKQGLERVVNTETGTGRLSRVPGIIAAGKTGTAQVPPHRSHAWFCGYAPAEDARVAFVIFLEHGGKGGLRAAQVAGQMLAYLKEMEYL